MSKKNTCLGVACAVGAAGTICCILAGNDIAAILFAIATGIDGFFAGWGRYGSGSEDDAEGGER
ncbi:hypothetical protein [Pseudoscardovia radai]|uniref:hypothetical protein n=1 Tax=Pseudoscardovia radai TaxID=987066 RepID=UPI0027101AC7|nr:hypothetical protein [Pseudoscardovia radai]